MSSNVGPAPAGARLEPLPEVRGSVAVVTGASRGLGAGLAARFVELGMRVGLCARGTPEPPPGAPVDRVVSASVDVTDAAAVDAFCSQVVDALGPIDLWVNNAGVLDPIGPLRDADPAAVAEHIGVNLLGVVHGAATYARHVRSRGGGGALVDITSGAASTPYAGWALYCASKAGVDQLSRVLAVEEADADLRVLAVAPGVVDTDMQAAIRATPPERFPRVQRFRDLRARGAFNSPAWVADHILRYALGPVPADGPVVVRVPEEPRPA
ncbi:MAG TPA: SDR family NAD(P)-dependent oxidoreductase [Acidimicrobiales bacterium]